MIPLSLHLTDFLSYKKMDEPLDLSGLHVACLSGANGNGKSALLDAITWSLWGKARGSEGGVDQEKLIRDGADTARVELVFDLDGRVYRVARQRSRNGKSDLQFNVQADDGSWTDLAGEGIADTQRRISQQLRMEYETFVASAFILQGRADEFTRMKPADRKDVLAKILGLEIYERLSDRAKEYRKTNEAHADANRQDAEKLEADLAIVPETETGLAEADALVAEAVKAHEAVAIAVTEAQVRLAGALSVEAEVAHIKERRTEIATRLASARDELAALDEEARSLTEASAAGDEQRAVAARVPELEEASARAEEKRARDAALAQEENDLQQRIAVERAGLNQEQKSLIESLAQSLTERAALAEAPALLDAASAAVEKLDVAEAERESLLERHRSLDAEAAAEQAAIAHRATARADLAERIERLTTAEAECPVCAQPLTKEHRRTISAEAKARLADLDAADKASRKKLKEIESGLKTIVARGKELRALLDGRAALERRIAEVRQRINRAGDVEADIARMQKRLDEINAVIEADADAPTERQKLASVRKERLENGFDAEALRALADQLNVARAAERALRDASEAAARLEVVVRSRGGVAGRIKEGESALAACEKELEAKQSALAEMPALREAGTRVRLDLERIQSEIVTHKTTAARLRERLVALAQTAERAKAAREAHATSRALAKRYEIIQKAFGRDGIPARIIGNAVPELVTEANRLLGMLTDGRLTVTIDLARPTKSKTIKETLDITVYDTQGKRAYEMYSGGERLRIDFALRIALSRLLARRANTRLETLVIDEGFGSQDAEGRARLVEAILKVRDDFRRILVITHVEDLKERFPTRIEVTKDRLEGSRAEVI